MIFFLKKIWEVGFFFLFTKVQNLFFGSRWIYSVHLPKTSVVFCTDSVFNSVNSRWIPTLPCKCKTPLTFCTFVPSLSPLCLNIFNAFIFQYTCKVRTIKSSFYWWGQNGSLKIWNYLDSPKVSEEVSNGARHWYIPQNAKRIILLVPKLLPNCFSVHSFWAPMLFLAKLFRSLQFWYWARPGWAEHPRIWYKC